MCKVVRDHQRPIRRHIRFGRIKHIGHAANDHVSSNHVPGIVYEKPLILIFHPARLLQFPIDRKMPVPGAVLKTLYLLLLAADPQAEVRPQLRAVHHLTRAPFAFGVVMPDHPIGRDPRLLDQMFHQIHTVKPGLVVVAVRINAYFNVDRIVIVDSGHQRRTVLLPYRPCSVRVVECLVDRYIVNIIMNRCRQISVVVCPGMRCSTCSAVKIVRLMDYDVLWVILTCIAIDLLDLFRNRYQKSSLTKRAQNPRP